jgi:hypothetical protein
MKTLQETGKTNLGSCLTKYFNQKAENERQALVPKDVMIPPSLL